MSCKHCALFISHLVHIHVMKLLTNLLEDVFPNNGFSTGLLPLFIMKL